MMVDLLSYHIPEIPDPFFNGYQSEAGGDVLSAIGKSIEYLLRSISAFPQGSISVSIRIVYNPKLQKGDKQSRLQIYLVGNVQHSEKRESLKLLLENGPLSRFYDFQSKKPIDVPSDNLKIACEIVRNTASIEPLYTPEFNYQIPPYYYRIDSFEPDLRNNYMDLDRVLSNVKEKIIINFCIEPIIIMPELKGHTRYLAQLQAINRNWGHDEDDDFISQDYIGNKNEVIFHKREVLKPLRHSDPLAEYVLRHQQRFHEELGQPHLGFQAAVFAQSQEIAQLIASSIAESAFLNGKYKLSSYSKGQNRYDELCQSLKKNCLIKTCGKNTKGKSPNNLYDDLARLTNAATINELKTLFMLPVSFLTSPRCIRKNTDPVHKPAKRIINIGASQAETTLPVNLMTELLAKHLFITGLPGVGKTTFAQNLLLQLYNQKIPFTVIESAKTDYRILKTLKKSSNKNARDLALNLQVYTPGVEDISPFRHNPLVRQEGISIDEHIEDVLACFMATIPMSGPLPSLLGEALERVYEMFPDMDNPPILTDLVDSIEEVMAEKKYSSDPSSDLLEAQRVRLGGLVRRSIGQIFQCRHSFPNISTLINKFSLVELYRLSIEKMNNFTLSLLSSIAEYLKTAPKTGRSPRFVILIEEAHNIVGTNSHAQPSPDNPDSKAYVTEFVCRMLTEFRSLEVGIVILDQSPSAVAQEIIKSTATKLCFKQVQKQDREEIGAAMLLQNHEIEELARLNTGEGFFFTEGYYRPIKIKTPNLHDRFDLSTPVQYKEILPFIQDDNWYKEIAVKRTATELQQLHDFMNQFDDDRIQILKCLASIISLHPHIMAESRQTVAVKKLEGLNQKAKELRQRLHESSQKFIRDVYLRYLPPEDSPGLKNKDIKEMYDQLKNRFTQVIQPGIEDSIKMIDSFIDRCHRS